MLELFKNEEPKTSEVFSKSPDDEVHDKIVTTLCAKRKALEWNLTNRPSEEYKVALEEHVEKMHLFGISEVDYAVFQAKQPEEPVH